MFDPTLRGLLSQVEMDKVILFAMLVPIVVSKERLLSWDLLEPGAFLKLLGVCSAKIKDRAALLFGRSEDKFDALFS